VATFARLAQLVALAHAADWAATLRPAVAALVFVGGLWPSLRIAWRLGPALRGFALVLVLAIWAFGVAVTGLRPTHARSLLGAPAAPVRAALFATFAVDHAGHVLGEQRHKV